MSHLKNQNWLWIGGWASHLLCWRESIQILNPNINHYFIDSLACIDNKEFKNSLKEHISAYHINYILCWSMGSLLMHQHLEKQTQEFPINILSIAPIFEFCQSKTNPKGWNKRILKRMKNGLKQDKNTVLKQFWDTMTLHQPNLNSNTSEYFINWYENTKKYKASELLLGLDFLEQQTINIDNLQHHTKLKFWINPQDVLSYLPKRSKHQQFPYTIGHIPFLSEKIPFQNKSQ